MSSPVKSCVHTKSGMLEIEYEDGSVFSMPFDNLISLIGERVPPIYLEIWRRRLQQKAKGYTTAHDDMHTDGSIADAAACYASPNAPLKLWPWRCCPLPDHTDRRERLVDAAALCIAEIERMERK